MNTRVEQTPESLNPLFSISKDGTILYSNDASEPILNGWGVRVGDKLPLSIVDLVQRVISRKSPEKIEVKAGNKVYLVVLSPLPEQELVSISGFDISDHRELREEIKQSEERLKALMDHNPSLVFLKDECGRYVYLNKSYEKQFVHSEDWYGKTDFDFWPKESAELFQANDSLVLKSGHIHQFVEDSTDLNGTRYCWLNYKFPFINSKNKKYVGGIGIDITDRVRAEEDLRESEERFSKAFYSSPAALCITRLSDGMIVDVNESYLKMFCYSWQELVGHTSIELGMYSADTVSRDKLLNLLQKNGYIQNFEMNFRTKAGELISAIFSVEPININGQSHIITTFLDITERKRTEETLKESEERFRSAFDDSAVAMALVCPDARLLKVNDAFCRMLGFEKSEMEGLTFLDFTYPDDIEPSISTHKAVINREKPLFWLEKRYIRKDGRVIWCEVSSSPVFDSKGCPIYTVAHIQDITDRKNAEEELWKSENRFRVMFEEHGAPMLLIEPNSGQIIDANEAAARFYEYSREQLRAMYIDQINQLPPGEVATERCNAVKRIKNVFVFTHRLASGDERLVEVYSSPVTIEGRPMLFSIIHDITLRKKAEEALKMANETLEARVQERTSELEKAYNSLKESEERLAEAQRIARIGGWDWDIVTNKMYRSDELYHIFRLSPQEFDTTYGILLNYVHPDDRNHIDIAVKEALKGKPIDNDYRIILADGEECIVHMTGEVIFDEKNNPVHMIGTVQDITERKKAEYALYESEERLRLSQKAAKIGSFEWNIQTGVNVWTPELEAMYGLQPGEFNKTEEAWEQLVNPEDRQNAIRLVDQAIQTGEPTEGEWRVIWSDGSVHWLTGRWQVFKDATGQPVRMTGVNIDITERRKAEEALAKVEIVRKQEIHHRIKNNLQVISSLLDLQAEKFRGKKNIEDFQILESFQESQDRVISMALIHEELHKGGKPDTLNISRYIEELANNLLLTYSVCNNGISLDMDVEEDIFFDMDTSVPLGIIVNELVSNSLKHAFSGRDKGEIQIKLKRVKNGECEREDCNPAYVLMISDNGIGIPEKIDIENLDSLGLQLVTSLVDQLDGQLELKRNQGTEFIIRFTVKER